MSVAKKTKNKVVQKRTYFTLLFTTLSCKKKLISINSFGGQVLITTRYEAREGLFG